MAGWQIETPAAGSTDWTDFETQLQYTRSGLLQLSLNPIADGTTVPKIAIGSKVDISGGLYYFGSTETVSGSATTTNTNYIMLTTSSSSITASFTSEVPTWSASKNGWYDVTGNKRMIGRLDFDSTTYEWIGLLPRGESVWDKNGREVTAMQMETKNTTTTVTNFTQVDRDVIGFSFTPTAIIDASLTYWTSGTSERTGASDHLFSVGKENAVVKLSNATVGANKVTLRVLTAGAANTTYNVKTTVTAARTG